MQALCRKSGKLTAEKLSLETIARKLDGLFVASVLLCANKSEKKHKIKKISVIERVICV